MNLQPLYEQQKVLDEHIIEEHGLHWENLLPRKILALQVELGELANEWRGFKFWSWDQEPRGKEWADRLGEMRNPLLEEYVDCLHFILSIGLELGYDEVNFPIFYERQSDNIIEQFNKLFDKTGDFSRYKTTGNYKMILSLFSGLGEMLGFTWKEVEQAYEFKNAINHERQNTGY